MIMKCSLYNKLDNVVWKKERLKQVVYFTEYKLTEEEYRHMDRMFQAKINPNYKKEEDLSL